MYIECEMLVIPASKKTILFCVGDYYRDVRAKREIEPLR